MYLERAAKPDAPELRVDRRDGPREALRQLPLAEECLGELLQSLRPRLEAVALRLTRDGDAAGDVVQSAFEKALRHRAQFRGQARVSTWLHRIVTNEALMWLRSERRRTSRVAPLLDGDVETIADSRPGPLEDLDAHRSVRRLREGIASLGPEERDVIERCVLPGRTYLEYARQRGVHPAAAKSRAFRARRRLQGLLSE